MTEQGPGWLIKSEPASYGFADLVRDGGTEWDGVRNAAAALNLRRMAVGDPVLVYHSMTDKAVVGIARVTRAARPDATAGEGDGERWVSVALAPVRAFTRPVALASLRADPRLAGLAMLRQSRLSVSPVAAAEWAAVLALAAG